MITLPTDRHHFNLPPEYAPYVHIIFGILLLYFGITAVKKANRLSKHGIKTQGVLIRLYPKRSFSISIGSGTGRTHRDNDAMEGIYRFTDEQGNEHEIKGTAHACSVIGSSTTTVLYHPQNPDDAITTDSGMPQLVPLIVTLVGTGMTAYGLFQLPL